MQSGCHATHHRPRLMQSGCDSYLSQAADHLYGLIHGGQADVQVDAAGQAPRPQEGVSRRGCSVMNRSRFACDKLTTSCTLLPVPRYRIVLSRDPPVLTSHAFLWSAFVNVRAGDVWGSVRLFCDVFAALSHAFAYPLRPPLRPHGPPGLSINCLIWARKVHGTALLFLLSVPGILPLYRYRQA